MKTKANTIDTNVAVDENDLGASHSQTVRGNLPRRRHQGIRSTCAAICGLLLLAGAAKAQFGDPSKPLPAMVPACATFAGGGGNGSFTLTRGSVLTARSLSSFIRITSVSAPKVNYSVAPNYGCERSGTIVTDVGTFTVKQAGVLPAPTGLAVHGVSVSDGQVAASCAARPVPAFTVATTGIVEEQDTIGTSSSSIKRYSVSWNPVACAEVYHMVIAYWDVPQATWVGIHDVQTSDTGFEVMLHDSLLHAFTVQAGDPVFNTCGTSTIWGGYAPWLYYHSYCSNL